MFVQVTFDVQETSIEEFRRQVEWFVNYNSSMGNEEYTIVEIKNPLDT